jgi:hypothetical protein
MATSMQTQVSVTTDAIDVKNIRSIELPDGWHSVRNCELVQFAVGESRSPITPFKLYPALRYQNDAGKTVRTPLSKILSFSEEQQSR